MDSNKENAQEGKSEHRKGNLQKKSSESLSARNPDAAGQSDQVRTRVIPHETHHTDCEQGQGL